MHASQYLKIATFVPFCDVAPQIIKNWGKHYLPSVGDQNQTCTAPQIVWNVNSSSTGISI